MMRFKAATHEKIKKLYFGKKKWTWHSALNKYKGSSAKMFGGFLNK